MSSRKARIVAESMPWSSGAARDSLSAGGGTAAVASAQPLSVGISGTSAPPSNNWHALLRVTASNSFVI
jgi:hypothetical protein